MRFNELVELAGGLGCFDLPLLVQMAGGDRESIRVQLSRWMKAGKVIGLRRGYYALAMPFRRTPLVAEVLANQLCHPSYLSGLWALAYYGLIPEGVAWFTSVTSRSPCRYDNVVGVFVYQNVSQERFFGYKQVESGSGAFFLAEPEKAVLDHWHLSDGAWTAQRLTEMRYQYCQKLDRLRLQEYAARFDSPRIMKATEIFLKQVAGVTADEGENVEL